MIKGTQRQVVMLRTAESESFEMAYFVVRPDVGVDNKSKSMIDEANEIVSSVCVASSLGKKEKRKQIFRKMLLFLAGAIFGALSLWATLGLLFGA